MSTIKALTFTEFGELDKVSVSQIPKPSASANKVLVQVKACGLNPVDQKRIQGMIGYLAPELDSEPNVIGYDLAGIVEEVGAGVTKFQKGDEVYAQLTIKDRGGAIAEYVAVDADLLALKPKTVSFDVAAAMPLAATTALQVLRNRGGLTGETPSKVFVTAGAGGVGGYVIQIAKILGATEIVTTASPGVGTELCKKLGATRVVDYKSEKIEEVLKGGEFDVAFDCTNEVLNIIPMMKQGGRIVSIACMGRYPDLKDTLGELTPEAKAFFEENYPKDWEEKAEEAGCQWLYHLVKPSGADMEELAKWTDEGLITTVIDEAVSDSIDNFKVSFDKLWSGRAKGKCIIKM